ncbi:vinexin isoform X2 [Apus apus]|uniref:vinexin isoform X2 n=1 Tax=Apus apus TaxID=8895 RepID=UPI0021F8E716|nr:vinexin isoform X2 [Apus apus]
MASGPWMRLGCPSPHARVSTAPATGTAACSGSSTAGCQSQTGTPTTAPRGSAAPRPPQCPPPPPDPRRKGPSPTKSPGIPNGLDWTGWGDTGATAEPGSIFDYEPGKSSVLEQEQQPPAAVPLGWAQPIEPSPAGAAGTGAGAAQQGAGQGYEGHGDTSASLQELGGCSRCSFPCSGLPTRSEPPVTPWAADPPLAPTTHLAALGWSGVAWAWPVTGAVWPLAETPSGQGPSPACLT